MKLGVYSSLNGMTSDKRVDFFPKKSKIVGRVHYSASPSLQTEIIC